MGQFVDEFRGTDNLVYAEVLTDNNNVGEGYTTGAVKVLAPVAEISKSVETAQDTKYYDNKPALTINAEGADTITLTVPALDLETLAAITGKTYDSTTGAFMDGERTPKYFALGYRLKLTDGTYRYVWRYKGSFGIPDETSQTENNGTDSNNQTLTFTGIMTQHKFTKSGTSEKALVVDERSTSVDLSTFFAVVTTCDSFGGGSIARVMNSLSHVTTDNAATSVAVGGTYNATLTPEDGYTLDDVVVLMNAEDVTSTAWTVGTQKIAIASVTGDIVVAATAVSSN